MPNTLDRKAQLQRLRERYGRRNKPGKGRMLDELCEQHGYDRKHAIKLLGDTLPQLNGTPPPGPPPRYEPVREVLANVWERAEQLCGKRLAPALALWLPHYGKHFNRLLPSQTKLLREISPATIDGMLAGCKAAPPGLCGTKPGILLRQQIPIAGEVWDERRAGFLEVGSCFWHGCPKHATRPKNNTAFWRRKLSSNKQRDLLVTQTLRRAGWRVLRIW